MYPPALLLLLLPPLLHATSTTSPPHIVHILIDDFGWNQVSYHTTSPEVVTPNIASLAASGIELNRHYVHKICSPSRSSIQSGRNPIHVNVQNVHPEVVNAEDEVGGWQGVPLNMTTLPRVLGETHETHFVGKWDVGMATNEHTPAGRGYGNFFGYFHHSNDYWQQTEQKCRLKPVKDLWLYNATYDGPATWLANDDKCTDDNQAPRGRCVYEEELLLDAVLDTIDNAANATKPLFLFYSTHLTHMPLQIPAEVLALFPDVDNEYRQRMRAMSYYVDMEVGKVVDKLKETGMWENTMLVLHSDNGGEIMTQFCGSNNFPLRGGKFSNFEGGIRVNAVVGGGWVPPARRGVKEESLVAGEDWLATYAEVAGVGDSWVTDHEAVGVGLPDFDSVSQVGMLLGEGGGRKEIVVGDTTAIAFNADGGTLVGGVIDEEGWKILVGAENKRGKICQDVTTVDSYPNGRIRNRVPELVCRECGRTPETGCLFNVFSDETESFNKASVEVEVFERLLKRVDELQRTVYSPDRGKKDKRACKAVRDDYGGYWGPFVM